MKFLIPVVYYTPLLLLPNPMKGISNDLTLACFYIMISFYIELKRLWDYVFTILCSRHKVSGIRDQEPGTRQRQFSYVRRPG